MVWGGGFQSIDYFTGHVIVLPSHFLCVGFSIHLRRCLFTGTWALVNAFFLLRFSVAGHIPYSVPSRGTVASSTWSVVYGFLFGNTSHPCHSCSNGGSFDFVLYILTWFLTLLSAPATPPLAVSIMFSNGWSPGLFAMVLLRPAVTVFVFSRSWGCSAVVASW